MPRFSPAKGSLRLGAGHAVHAGNGGDRHDRPPRRRGGPPCHRRAGHRRGAARCRMRSRSSCRSGRPCPALAGFSTEENAAVAVNYLTAWVALMEMARLRPTDRVLVTAAAGGVGSAAVQIATRFGCSHRGAGRQRRQARTRSGRWAPSRPSNYRRADFEERLRAAAGPERFDVVVEVVGGEVFRAVWPVLAPFGRVVVAGFASLALQRWNPLSWLRTWRDLPKADIRSLAPSSHGLLGTHIGYLLDDPPRLAQGLGGADRVRHGTRDPACWWGDLRASRRWPRRTGSWSRGRA